MWDVVETVELKDCPSCGENNWVKFEKPLDKPLDAPYYKCCECLEAFPANEIEYYIY